MAQYDINLREYWRILKKRRILVILTALILGVFSTFFAILRAPTPLYSSECSIKFEKQTTLEGLYARTITWPGTDDIKTQMSIIKSYFVFQRVAERLRLIPKKGITGDSPLQSKIIPIIESLQSKVEITREELTNILNIDVVDPNPVFAQRLANTIALTYKEQHAEQQMKRSTEALKYISEQLRKTRQNLRESEDEFNRFSQDNKLVSIDMQSENLLVRSQKIQDEIRELREDKRELGDVLQRLEQFIENPTGSNPKFYSKKTDSQYQAVNTKVVGLMLKKDTLLKAYTLQHPQVVAISNEIIENARKMRILLQLQISDMGKNGVDLRKEQEKVERKTLVLMDKKLEFNRLKRKVQLHNDLTVLLEQKNQEVLIKKAEKPEEITIVKPALLPTKPVNPPKTATTGAMGAVIGVVLGLVIAFIMETFDTSLGAIEDVEETLGTQVLGVIPHGDERDIQRALKDKYPEGLQEASEKEMTYMTSHFVPKSMMAENFRALRTNIQFMDTEKKLGSIVITSTSPQEGKTIVAINLAIAMVQSGMKILLVGSDLRKPMLGKVFGIETAPGLTDILLGNYPWRDTVKGITDMILGKMTFDEVMMTPGLDNLHIITAGPVPPNPAELMDSDRLLHFIKEAEEEYDLIIFDSPPVLSAADAAILGTKVDGVLLVYRLGAVSRGLLKRSTTQLQQINCHIMGVILNGMRPEVSPDFHDYGYYKYYYAYGEEDKDSRGRKSKKGFSFGWKKGAGGRTPDRVVVPESVGRDSKDGQGKKPNVLRLSLMGIALVLLAMGILWHNGIMDPFKPLSAERSGTGTEIKPSVHKRPSSTRARKPKTISPNQKGAVSNKKTRLAAKTPIPPTPTLAKDRAEIDSPASSPKSLPYSAQGAARTYIPPTSTLAKDWGEIDTPASPLNVLFYSKEKSRFDAVKPVHLARGRALSRPVQRKLKAVSKKPKRLITEERPKVVAVAPIPLDPTLAKAWTEIDTPASPLKALTYATDKPTVEAETPVRFTIRRLSNKVIQSKTETISLRPKGNISKKKHRLAAKTPMPPPPLVPKDRSEINTQGSSLKILSYPYSLYLGSFRNRERAQKAISIYSKKGHSPYWVKMDFKEKGVWFRVYTGHFKDREKAEGFRQDHRLKEATIKSTRYANLIGVYSNNGIELKNQMGSLKKLGYSPYVIEGQDGKTRVYVGGFFPKKRAVKQHHELKSKGIQSHVVMR